MELAKYGVDDALIKEFMDILNTCEFARYAPAQASMQWISYMNRQWMPLVKWKIQLKK